MQLTTLFQAQFESSAIFFTKNTETLQAQFLSWPLFVILFFAALVLIYWYKLKHKQKSTSFLRVHVRKKMDICWNLLTNTKLDYKPINELEKLADKQASLSTLISCFEENFLSNQEIRTTTTPKAILFNLNSVIELIRKIQFSLNTVNIKDIDNTVIEVYGKPTQKNLETIDELSVLISSFKEKTKGIDRFEGLQSIKNNYSDLTQMKQDVNFLIENKTDLNEFLLMNKRFIDVLRPYFE